ncbi:hypothetical protein PAAG_03017 [Paracoccidioides lutzii Pb01]|uniref:Protein kinase domain-containing protein n=1 Tax=Paracoccidioides lutzii (strain ATCC MYA-826 / Pb01) TaxID=502779 RepID=C1GY63_PARBA|nr:hypothetical protein PAAG_03017 [Paracoccidioides lutzii Pb01]EEH41454.1 hypothetical protein PAAG_03017 [Paracoccidioides lutzii Pb01]
MESRVQELLAELEKERRLREEERTLREIAETQSEKEKQLRQEERRRREEAEANSKALVEKERQLRQEERRQREEAEANSKPTTLPQFLHACHELLLAIRIVTNPTRTTKGAVTKPANRRVPSRITLWDTFVDEQMIVWERLNDNPSFLTEKLFPSKHQLEYIRQLITPITSEWDLRYFERDTVENQVRIIVDRITENEVLREALGLRGSVTFESHTNMGHPEENSLSEGVRQMSISPAIETRSSTKGIGKSQKRKEEPNSGTGGQADRFCIYRQEGDEHIPAIAIEYKAPHKLTQADMATGLTKEIRPAQDVIGQDSDDVEFCCRRLVAAVTTQLFSYMVRKGVRYGYVCTGEAFIFVYIPDDPSSVQCALCRPELDVKATGEDELRLTATAQVLAFTIRALTSPAVSQEWHDAAGRLDVWPVEYSEILEQTPPTARPKHASPLYRGRRPRNLPPFGMTLRYGCRPSEDKRRSMSSHSPSPPPSPPLTPSQFGIRGRTQRGGSGSAAKSRGAPGRGEVSGTQRTSNVIETPAIKTHPYCSQQCLLALRDGSPLDPLCPNYQDHQKGRIQIHGFRAGIRKQLATDRGPDADCRPLYKAGSCGALFKVRLSSHGYTVVAKGVEYKHVHKLKYEKKIYDELRDLQGECIPVCLGVVQLALKYPYYYDGGIYTHMLFLSWAGEAIQKASTLGHTADVFSMVHCALQAIHSKGVLHGDAEPRNILWNPTCQRVMIVDFERAIIRGALSDVSANSAREKRRLMKTCFSKELQRIASVFEDNVA